MQNLVCSEHLYFEEMHSSCLVRNMKCFPVILQLKEAGEMSFGKENLSRVLILFCCVCSMKRYLGSYRWNFLWLELQIRSLISPCHYFLFFTYRISWERKLLWARLHGLSPWHLVKNRQTVLYNSLFINSACVGDSSSILSVLLLCLWAVGSKAFFW